MKGSFGIQWSTQSTHSACSNGQSLLVLRVKYIYCNVVIIHKYTKHGFGYLWLKLPPRRWISAGDSSFWASSTFPWILNIMIFHHRVCWDLLPPCSVRNVLISNLNVAVPRGFDKKNCVEYGVRDYEEGSLLELRSPNTSSTGDTAVLAKQ